MDFPLSGAVCKGKGANAVGRDPTNTRPYTEADRATLSSFAYEIISSNTACSLSCRAKTLQNGRPRRPTPLMWWGSALL